jgi:uncharacterized paraquat-inducible protein A
MSHEFPAPSKRGTRHLENIGVTADSTDHFHFICPSCGAIMQVFQVLELKSPGTAFCVRCDFCGGEGYRKINWNSFTRRFPAL